MRSTKRRGIGSTSKRVDPFYYSKEWRKVRALALRRDSYRCVNCNTSVRGKGQARVDHIKRRGDAPGLALYLPNLRTLCVTCDNARHANDRARKRGETVEIGGDGFPVGSDWSDICGS